MQTKKMPINHRYLVFVLDDIIQRAIIIYHGRDGFSENLQFVISSSLISCCVTSKTKNEEKNHFGMDVVFRILFCRPWRFQTNLITFHVHCSDNSNSTNEIIVQSIESLLHFDKNCLNFSSYLRRFFKWHGMGVLVSRSKMVQNPTHWLLMPICYIHLKWICRFWTN